MNNFYPSTTGNGCVLCMTNSIVNVNKNGCTCIAGYTMINNACQPTNSLCTKDSFYNITTHQCQCLNPDQNYL